MCSTKWLWKGILDRLSGRTKGNKTLLTTNQLLIAITYCKHANVEEQQEVSYKWHEQGGNDRILRNGEMVEGETRRAAATSACVLLLRAAETKGHRR